MSDVVPTKFWLEDPSILFTDLVFFPCTGMTREEKLNALTRLSVVISLVLFAMDYQYWYVFLLASILIIVMAQYTAKARDEKQESFTIVPTRINDDFTSTVVAPVFAEEHRVPPPAYDMYDGSIQSLEDIPFEEPIRPQSYPYGQYLNRLNLLPGDEYLINLGASGGAESAREFANSAFMRNRLAFQENMTRIYKKKLDRRFRHSGATGDSFSPFSSY
jgi:hypothetical protein